MDLHILPNIVSGSLHFQGNLRPVLDFCSNTTVGYVPITPCGVLDEAIKYAIYSQQKLNAMSRIEICDRVVQASQHLEQLLDDESCLIELASRSTGYTTRAIKHGVTNNILAMRTCTERLESIFGSRNIQNNTIKPVGPIVGVGSATMPETLHAIMMCSLLAGCVPTIKNDNKRPYLAYMSAEAFRKAGLPVQLVSLDTRSDMFGVAQFINRPEFQRVIFMGSLTHAHHISGYEVLQNLLDLGVSRVQALHHIERFNSIPQKYITFVAHLGVSYAHSFSSDRCTEATIRGASLYRFSCKRTHLHGIHPEAYLHHKCQLIETAQHADDIHLIQRAPDTSWTTAETAYFTELLNCGDLIHNGALKIVEISLNGQDKDSLAKVLATECQKEVLALIKADPQDFISLCNDISQHLPRKMFLETALWADLQHPEGQDTEKLFKANIRSFGLVTNAPTIHAWGRPADNVYGSHEGSFIEGLLSYQNSAERIA